MQDDLRVFHEKHFPHAPAPEHFLHGVELEADEEYDEEYCEEEDEGLGYYPDGKKRTLTDAQIAMFRHSEIQSILRERRLRREDGEVSEDRSAAASPPVDAGRPNVACSLPTTPETTTPQPAMAASENADKIQAGRVAKTQTQQWATSSARTKAKNKKNRDKYKAKKRDIRIQKDLAKKNARYGGDDEDESDEWDPWHQANGPDVQKDDRLDLDY